MSSSQVEPNLSTYDNNFAVGAKGDIPLTTIFTPPSSCLSIVTFDGLTLWQGGLLQTGDQNCFPPYFTDIYNSWYSPAICPHGWTGISTSGLGLSEDITDKWAFCCPLVSTVDMLITLWYLTFRTMSYLSHIKSISTSYAPAILVVFLPTFIRHPRGRRGQSLAMRG